MIGDKHVSYANMAFDVWEKLTKEKEQIQSLGKYFHLRPTSAGVTIVSTLRVAPMRGIPSTNPEQLRKTLMEIFKKFAQITSDNDEKAQAALTELGFKMRKKGHNGLEENTQAVFINLMAHNQNLHDVLKSKGHIRFVASEVIFERGPNRIDVVGCDEENLYLFELKKDRTLDFEQAERYRKYYTDNRDALNSLLSVYPINKVEKCAKKNLRPVMIMRYAENSSNKEKWKNMAHKKAVEILFYQDSLAFTSV